MDWWGINPSQDSQTHWLLVLPWRWLLPCPGLWNKRLRCPQCSSQSALGGPVSGWDMGVDSYPCPARTSLESQQPETKIKGNMTCGDKLGYLLMGLTSEMQGELNGSGNQALVLFGPMGEMNRKNEVSSWNPSQPLGPNPKHAEIHRTFTDVSTLWVRP